jgi:hypothetical protein
MEQQNITRKITDEAVEFIQEYEQIMQNTNTVRVQTEWNQEGDYFQKLSMYDNRYTPVVTFGCTTLLK